MHLNHKYFSVSYCVLLFREPPQVELQFKFKYTISKNVAGIQLHTVGNEKERSWTETDSYHASSGASTSGLVKRLRHCSRVKCPALAVSLREPGSSSYSNSLELTRTYSFRRSLFFHTSSKVTSSGRSASASSAEGLWGGAEKQSQFVGLHSFLLSPFHTLWLWMYPDLEGALCVNRNVCIIGPGLRPGGPIWVQVSLMYEQSRQWSGPGTGGLAYRWHKYQLLLILLWLPHHSHFYPFSVCFVMQLKSHFWVVYLCLALCFSVTTWEDTTKRSASFTSFKTGVYCIFWQIVWVHMFLCCFQQAVTSATSSSSQDAVHHHNTVEHRIWP